MEVIELHTSSAERLCKSHHACSSKVVPSLSSTTAAITTGLCESEVPHAVRPHQFGGNDGKSAWNPDRVIWRSIEVVLACVCDGGWEPCSE